MKMTPEQWARLSNPVCSFCKTPLVFDGEGGAKHEDPAEAAVCGILSAGLPRAVLADDTPEAQALKAEGGF